MPSVITANLGPDGWAELRFPFERRVVDVVKSIPGSRWMPEKKCWRTSESALHILRDVIRTEGLGFLDVREPSRAHAPTIFLRDGKTLRPYQLTGVQRALTRPGYGLTWDPRVGKTPAAAAIISSAFASRVVERAFVFYPNSVVEEWERQLPQWTGLALTALEGIVPPTLDEIDFYASAPWLVLGCHYEILGQKAGVPRDGWEAAKPVRTPDYEHRPSDPTGLFILAERGPFLIVGDEVQNAKNKRAPRTKALLALANHSNCRHRIALTGTPMRNRPRDLWAFFDFIQPGSVGSPSAFEKRYCAAGHGENGYWENKGSSNEAELARRLDSVSWRLRRSDVADYLPKSDRKVFLCDLDGAARDEYKAAESALGVAAVEAMRREGADLKALEKLSAKATASKMDTLVERLRFHTVEREVKVLVFANFHESLKNVWDVLEPSNASPDGVVEASQAALANGQIARPGAPLGNVPVFCAGGWMLPDKRRKIREQWKACPGPAILLANTLSSGIGIDLSDADAAIFIELCWVPADFVQAESRIVDIHLGKRTTPPLFEYIITRGTIDADMGLTLIEKVQTIEAVVGQDAALSGIASTLRGSGAVESSNIALNKADPNAVAAALDRLRDRLLGKMAKSITTALAVEAADAFEEEGGDDGNEDEDEAA